MTRLEPRLTSMLVMLVAVTAPVVLSPLMLVTVLARALAALSRPPRAQVLMAPTAPRVGLLASLAVRLVQPRRVPEVLAVRWLSLAQPVGPLPGLLVSVVSALRSHSLPVPVVQLVTRRAVTVEPVALSRVQSVPVVLPQPRLAALQVLLLSPVVLAAQLRAQTLRAALALGSLSRPVLVVRIVPVLVAPRRAALVGL